jgi:hypothetical protein
LQSFIFFWYEWLIEIILYIFIAELLGLARRDGKYLDSLIPNKFQQNPLFAHTTMEYMK